MFCIAKNPIYVLYRYIAHISTECKKNAPCCLMYLMLVYTYQMPRKMFFVLMIIARWLSLRKIQINSRTNEANISTKIPTFDNEKLPVREVKNLVNRSF